MLMELSIRNFAIIDHITIPFEKGLTVLTGETGAGKSIIIDAIGQLIGGRGSVEYVRHGSKRAEIEGIFSIVDPKEIMGLIKDLDIEIDEDETIILKREITQQGKSVCRINGKLVTLAVLRQFGQALVDIHGQHEHQYLLQEDKHRFLLDRFSEQVISDAKREYENVFQTFIDQRNKVSQVSENEHEIMQRLDLLQFQQKEINEAKLKPDEDIILLEEKKRLDYSEDLYKSVHRSYEALYGEQKGLEWTMVAMNEMVDAATMDEKLVPLKETITNNYYLLEEVAYSLRNYYENIEFDPDRLNDIEARLSEINTLKRKYGKETVNDILEYVESLDKEIDTLKNRDERLQQWQNELLTIAKELLIVGKRLTDLRKKAAIQLKDSIQTELINLYMKDTNFEVEFNENQIEVEEIINIKKRLPISKKGIDSLHFLVSTNKGEPLKPLAKIASGGEMSRIILALKTILASHEGVTSLIFDEVDTGVSGRVAQAIAEKIHEISFGSQVLCISHLPQVAAMADNHLFIAKETNGDRVVTSVRRLKKSEQIEEIGRMISGVEITDLTREHAKELLIRAQQSKQ
ncbi:DNA repair protein RecN [Evansella sp. AB-rgal1]|uniref:DNA repair protein RecN n=1 Tax=Evansella sp. AB-rgal1 TaxID=3242696 RepID=UPI00359CBC43